MEARAARRSPAQLFALVFGAVYLLVGIVGFFATGFGDFAGETYDDKLILFALNPLHNIVHLGVGALWLFSAAKHETAKTVNLLVGAVYALVTILGFTGALTFLAIEDASSADNFLHLASAALALYYGSAGAEPAAASATT